MFTFGPGSVTLPEKDEWSSEFEKTDTLGGANKRAKYVV